MFVCLLWVLRTYEQKKRTNEQKNKGTKKNSRWCHIFQWHNPSGRTMALGSTQPLPEMSSRCISWGLRRPVRKADNLTTILCRCHEIWEP
jgi:hypothetical protein